MASGLYLHLPFCRVHCTYCAFAISTDLASQDRYTEAMLREIESAVPEEVDSVYFGGGTPSRTSLANLERIFQALRQRFVLDSGTEVSLEANPEDVSSDSLRAWRELGVTRLSIGVQSFEDGELAAIGRIHDRREALDALGLAAGSGLRINLDLILGLPGQTAESFRRTLATAAGLRPGHVSLYMLDLEDRTPLQVQVDRGRVALPDDERVAELYLEAVDRLAAAGLHQYEVSNFSRPGEECRHNLRYWSRGEYRGFGIAAHSFSGSRRFANTRDIRAYIERAPDAVDFAEELGPDEIRHEKLFLGLRQTAGLCYEALVELAGQEAIEWMERGLHEGWLRRRADRIAFTGAGFLRSNDYISQLF